MRGYSGTRSDLRWRHASGGLQREDRDLLRAPQKRHEFLKIIVVVFEAAEILETEISSDNEAGRVRVVEKNVVCAWRRCIHRITGRILQHVIQIDIDIQVRVDG